MKILIHSNAPWAGSGYGQQTALYALRFAAAGHDVAISTNWGLQGAGLHWGTIPVYPGDNTWGNRTLPIVAAHHAGGDARECLVLTLLDVYVLKQARLNDLQIASWVPVDHEPCPPRVHNFFVRSGSTPIAMSRFGQTALQQVGLDALYVPHGIETDVFRPIDGAKQEIRDRMKIPQDAFVVGMVARNQGISPSRKAFPQVFQAFAKFRARHTDAILYLHTDMYGFEDGINLFGLAEAEKIPREAIRWTHQGDIELGLIGSEDLAKVYNAFDVLANPSLGEGFGIPIVEAQSCGVPVIVTDITAMPELCGAGWVVGGDLCYQPSHGAHQRVPSVRELVEAFTCAYDQADSLSDKARAFALAYDADLVMADYWTPVLAQLEQKLFSDREVAPFDLAAGRQAVPA